MLVISFRLLSKLPLPLLHALGAGLGWLVYMLSPSYRRRLKNNIKQAGFANALSSAISEAGKNILELPFVWFASPARLKKAGIFANWEIAKQAIDAKKGVIFLTPHLGCFEMLAQVTALEAPLTVLYRPPRKKALQPLIEGARARHQLHLAPANLSGVRILLKTLKKGEAIGLLPDQVPQQGEGVWADFFGKQAYTMTLPAKLHQMTGAPVVLAYAERRSFGRGYTLRLIPFEPPISEMPEEQARAINIAMEQLIAQCPSQYLWSYNRYKQPAGVTSPSQGKESSS